MKCKYLDYIGLCKNEYKKKKELYKAVTSLKVAKEFLRYLENLNTTRDNRQQTIETKTSHIIGQSSIVISIVSLFIPMFAEHLDGLNLYLKIVILLIFGLLLFHFILAIFHAIKNLQIENSRYMEGATSTVTKENRAQNELDFINIQIKDLIQIINHNNPLTNKAAAGLVYASRCFKIGVGIFPIFILALLVSFSMLKNEVKTIKVENIKELNFETIVQDQHKVQKELMILRKSIDSLKLETKRKFKIEKKPKP